MSSANESETPETENVASKTAPSNFIALKRIIIIIFVSFLTIFFLYFAFITMREINNDSQKNISAILLQNGSTSTSHSYNMNSVEKQLADFSKTSSTTVNQNAILKQLSALDSKKLSSASSTEATLKQLKALNIKSK